jgi:hypothetical protein
MLITAGLVYVDNPAPVRALAQNLALGARDVLYQKRINFEGLNLVKAPELMKLIPAERSVVWWLVNRDRVTQELVRHSLVRTATLRSCTRFAILDWGCFTFAVEERVPSFAALIDEEVWILGQDGGLLFPVERSEFEASPLNTILARHLKRPVGSEKRLKMLQIAGNSPDLIHARLDYTRSALEIIEEHSKLEVSLARCAHDGEIRARFEGYPFEAVFDYTPGTPKTLITESQRLGVLVKQFGARAQTIRLIDLAYNKLAVVRFSEIVDKESKDKTVFTEGAARRKLKQEGRSDVPMKPQGLNFKKTSRVSEE